MLSITPEDTKLCFELFSVVQELSNKLSLQSFNIVVNNGASAGQTVFHLHWHFLAGKNIYSHEGLNL